MAHVPLCLQRGEPCQAAPARALLSTRTPPIARGKRSVRVHLLRDLRARRHREYGKKHRFAAAGRAAGTGTPQTHVVSRYTARNSGHPALHVRLTQALQGDRGLVPGAFAREYAGASPRAEPRSPPNGEKHGSAWLFESQIRHPPVPFRSGSPAGHAQTSTLTALQLAGTCDCRTDGRGGCAHSCSVTWQSALVSVYVVKFVWGCVSLSN